MFVNSFLCRIRHQIRVVLELGQRQLWKRDIDDGLRSMQRLQHHDVLCRLPHLLGSRAGKYRVPLYFLQGWNDILSTGENQVRKPCLLQTHSKMYTSALPPPTPPLFAHLFPSFAASSVAYSSVHLFMKSFTKFCSYFDGKFWNSSTIVFLKCVWSHLPTVQAILVLHDRDCNISVAAGGVQLLAHLLYGARQHRAPKR